LLLWLLFCSTCTILQQMLLLWLLYCSTGTILQQMRLIYLYCSSRTVSLILDT
jgi:hypothetical protein